MQALAQVPQEPAAAEPAQQVVQAEEQPDRREVEVEVEGPALPEGQQADLHSELQRKMWCKALVQQMHVNAAAEFTSEARRRRRRGDVHLKC